MIHEGAFRARGVSATMIQSSKKGTPGISVTLRLVDGPSEGSNVDWIGWLTDATRARTAESLALMGFDGEDLATVTRQEVVAVIEHESFTIESGEERKTPRVKWINDPKRGGASFAPMDAAQQKSMLSDLRGMVLSSRAAQQQGGTGAEFSHGANVGSSKPKF